MNQFEPINYNINVQPVPTTFNEGYSQYEVLSKLLYLINQNIDNMNIGADEIELLKKQAKYLSETGDFTGTWNGLEMHLSDEGLATDWNSAKGVFNTVTERLNDGDTKTNTNTSDITNLPKLDYVNTLLDTFKKRFESRFINVKDYGAKGDGVSDDTTAIQNSINYLKTLGGGTVFFPKGVYMISSVIEYGHNIFLEGLNMHHSYWNWEGACSVIKCFPTFSGTTDIEGTQVKTMFESRWYGNCGMKNIKLDGNGVCGIGFAMYLNDGDDYNNNLNQPSKSGHWFENCQLCNFTVAGIKGKYRGINRIHNCNFGQCNIGIQYYQCGDSNFIGNYFNTNSASGIMLLFSSNSTIIGGKVEYNDIGINIYSCDDIIINSVNIDGCGKSGIKINYENQQCKNIVINSCIFVNNGKDITGDDSAHIQANGFKDLSIVGNSFRQGDVGNPSYAMRSPNFNTGLYNDGLLIAGNIFSDNCYITSAVHLWQCTKNHVIRDNKGLSSSNVTLGDGTNQAVYQIP